ncbi:MAG: hypothetical protein ABSB50_16335 [Terracidiphilus sp.]|jgi:hypothetical protein
MSERAEDSLQKIAKISLFTAAAACVVLWLVRIYYALSFFTPFMMVTTGLEEESLFSVWKFTQHQAVYADPYRIPFAASYFNWAYYWFYGSITSACLHLLHLDAIWIPTIGRLVTLGLTCVAGAMFCLTAREFVTAGLFAQRPFRWAWCVIAVTSPLIGFWSITVRPDIGALLFEWAGLYLILRCLRNQDNRLIVVAALLFYLAWAFKQSSVTIVTGSALTLLLFRRWRPLLTLCVVWWSLAVATLVVGGHTYCECLLFSQRHLPLVMSMAFKNALRAEFKNPFLVLCLAAMLVLLWKARPLRSRPAETALVLVASFSICFALVTAGKAGANDNYYIPVGWAVMLGFALASERMHARWLQAGLIVCSWLIVAGIALTPTGKTFYYNYRGQDAAHRLIADKLAHLPGPAIVTDRYSNLPWVQTIAPHFVLAYTYRYDRSAGIPFEDGGWEGLAQQGYFATIVYDQMGNPPPFFLDKYTLVDEYRDAWSDFKFYRRIQSAP